MDNNGAELIYLSEDHSRMVVEEMVLYEFTHFNEDGVAQFKIVGITAEPEEAEKYLAGKPAKFRRAKQVF